MFRNSENIDLEESEMLKVVDAVRSHWAKKNGAILRMQMQTDKFVWITESKQKKKTPKQYTNASVEQSKPRVEEYAKATKRENKEKIRGLIYGEVLKEHRISFGKKHYTLLN